VIPGAGLPGAALVGRLVVPLHGGASVGRPSHAVVLSVAVVAFCLLAWGGTVAIDRALGRLS
jgi:hypothetical protein